MPTHGTDANLRASLCCPLLLVAAIAGVALNAEPLCFTANYTTVPDDPNLRTSVGQGGRSDDASNGGPFGLGQAGTAWYRLPATHSLPNASPGPGHCGTHLTGWLSGCPAGAAGQLDVHYATPAYGALPPPVGATPAAGFVCFDDGGGATCRHHTPVRAVSCGPFVLWELPPSPFDNRYGDSGYCLQA